MSGISYKQFLIRRRAHRFDFDQAQRVERQAFEEDYRAKRFELRIKQEREKRAFIENQEQYHGPRTSRSPDNDKQHEPTPGQLSPPSSPICISSSSSLEDIPIVKYIPPIRLVRVFPTYTSTSNTAVSYAMKRARDDSPSYDGPEYPPSKLIALETEPSYSQPEEISNNKEDSNLLDFMESLEKENDLFESISQPVAQTNPSQIYIPSTGSIKNGLNTCESRIEDKPLVRAFSMINIKSIQTSIKQFLSDSKLFSYTV
jgi:hypothetical protein